MSNVTSVIKHFSTSNEGFVTTVLSQVAAGGVTVVMGSTAGLVDGTVFVGVVEPGLLNQQVFTGTVQTSSNSIINVVWTRGTNVIHAAGVVIVDYVTGTDHNMMSKGITKEHDQDGTHGFITAESLSVAGVNFFNLIPAGSIVPFGGAAAPAFWSICDGAAVSRTTFNGLFTVIGTTYGVGDGTTTFNLPDMRGRTPVGADPTAVRNTLSNVLGQVGGSQNQVLTTGQLPVHGLGFGHHGDEAGSVVRSPTVVGGVFSSTVISNTYRQSTSGFAGSASHMQPTWSFGNNEAHNNMQPYQNFNYIIKT